MAARTGEEAILVWKLEEVDVDLDLDLDLHSNVRGLPSSAQPGSRQGQLTAGVSLEASSDAGAGSSRGSGRGLPFPLAP